jgi:hypothetical protein
MIALILSYLRPSPPRPLGRIHSVTCLRTGQTLALRTCTEARDTRTGRVAFRRTCV